MCLNILSFGTNISGFCPKIFQFLSQHFQKYVQTFDISFEDFQNVSKYFQFLRQHLRLLSRDFQVSASNIFRKMVKQKRDAPCQGSSLGRAPSKNGEQKAGRPCQGSSLGRAPSKSVEKNGDQALKDDPWRLPRRIFMKNIQTRPSRMILGGSRSGKLRKKRHEKPSRALKDDP